MSIYSKNFINNALYEDVAGYSETFFAKFQNNAIHKIAYIENNLIVFNNSNNRSKGDVFSKWLKETKILDRPCNYSFHKVYTRLASKKLEQRKNADLREFFSFENFYMVKKYFTFGLQTVQKDTYHFIMTTKKPLDLFLATKKINQPDGFFEKTLEADFEKTTLDAEKTLLLYPDYQYIVIAPSKCIFYFSRAYQKVFSNIHSLTVPNKVQEDEQHCEESKSELELFVVPGYESITSEIETVLPEPILNGFGLQTNEIPNVAKKYVPIKMGPELNKVQHYEKKCEPIACGIKEIQDVRQQYQPVCGLENVLS